MRRSLRKSKCKRNQTGGGLGGGWGFSPSSLGSTVNNVLAYEPIGNCRGGPDVVRPGFLEGGYTGPKGLPGMSGGSRRRRNNRKSKASRKGRKNRRNIVQAGGRYGMGPFDGAGMGTPWGSAMAPTMAIGCEASRTAIPDSGAANVLNKVGGPLWDSPTNPAGGQRGGGEAVAGNAAATSWSEPAATSQAASITVPTAGMTHLRNPDDVIQTGAGTLEMINVPMNGRIMNPACLTTGGGRRSRKTSRKGRKASRKNKKSRRSNRK